MKIDILAFGAHPDDVELSCGGTIFKEIQNGKTVGIIDLTKGELGTRGTAETRKKEADKAAKILGVEFRENMNFLDRDGTTAHRRATFAIEYAKPQSTRRRSARKQSRRQHRTGQPVARWVQQIKQSKH